ncbi:Glycine cleavage H-protein, subgroup [Candidatus Omnitrophus magneticus]|uniref:Glycine cleavage system H protein n=1 Tax=Candidatus Omnitrophus magneticus TaxID=1609969 RepID=A0A0F0CK93_9BACT|nr:Glycine cleavage H-protein, subgroup [Candidatus Omnitrophus magneticus]
MYPEDLKYTKDHEWVKLEGMEAIIGITDHAQSALGDITFIELPKETTMVNQGDTISTIESVKAASDIFTPVSGRISDINKKLENAPEIINQSPYDEGWICRIEINDETELEKLMTAEEYEKYLDKDNN